MTAIDLAPVAVTFFGVGVLAMMLGGRMGDLVMKGCFVAACLTAIVAAWLP